MAKANQKVTKEEEIKKALKGIKKGFGDIEEIFTTLVEHANEMNMELLAQSLELDISILKTYKQAWNLKIKEETT